jgi:hypothetical protein
MIYTFKLPDDFSEKLIGEYDREIGDSPHNLSAFRNVESWVPTIVKFRVNENKIDAIPCVNMPLKIFRADLANEVKKVCNNEVALIQIKVFFKEKTSKEKYFVVFPLNEVEIWDLKKSEWAPLNTPDWPKDQPMHLYNMVLKGDAELKYCIAINKHWNSMFLFNSAVKEIIEKYSKWVTIFEPQNYKQPA